MDCQYGSLSAGNRVVHLVQVTPTGASHRPETRANINQQRANLDGGGIHHACAAAHPPAHDYTLANAYPWAKCDAHA